MKTLTITDAKKNLGAWPKAAARGEDIGIVSGSDIIALGKVPVESTDYAQTEYGADANQVAALGDREALPAIEALRRIGDDYSSRVEKAD